MALVLLGEWGFLGGALRDTSGNGRHGVFSDGGAGGQLEFVAGPQPGTRGVRFGHANHSISYGRTGLEPAVDGVTIMGWVRVAVGAPSGVLLNVLSKARAPGSTRSRIGGRWDGAINTVPYAARWKDDLHFADVAGSFTTGWHHVAAVDGNTGWAIYLDGAVIASGARAFDNTSSPSWENYPWVSGRDSVIADQYADSALSISGVRILQGEATGGEISEWMLTPITDGSAFFGCM